MSSTTVLHEIANKYAKPAEEKHMHDQKMKARFAKPARKGKLLCSVEKKTMPAIGFARKNGKAHPDWDSRPKHKKCLNIS